MVTGGRAEGDMTMTPQERRAKYRENQNYFSSKISELARYIGFGLVAVSFSLLSSDAIFAKSLVEESLDALVFAGILGVGTIISDYIHLLLGWLSNTRAANNANGDYELGKIGEILRFFQDWIFFNIKQLLPLAGAIFLLCAISKVINL